jgi:hypothetical protein
VLVMWLGRRKDKKCMRNFSGETFWKTEKQVGGQY